VTEIEPLQENQHQQEAPEVIGLEENEGGNHENQEKIGRFKIKNVCCFLLERIDLSLLVR
jgi:hypothetical protein